jgi:hypothetical protein
MRQNFGRLKPAIRTDRPVGENLLCLGRTCLRTSEPALPIQAYELATDRFFAFLAPTSATDTQLDRIPIQRSCSVQLTSDHLPAPSRIRVRKRRLSGRMIWGGAGFGAKCDPDGKILESRSGAVADCAHDDAPSHRLPQGDDSFSIRLAEKPFAPKTS